MDERFITTSGGPEIAYATLGDPAHPPLLLISGVGTQMISFAAGFRRRLAEAGLYVIHYDNRDCGHSGKLDGVPARLTEVFGAMATGEVDRARAAAPYTLVDMASDGVAVLNGLGIDRAAVLGVSMGGMIAQNLAIHWPERVSSLISVMSRSGDPDYGQATPEAMAVLTRPAAEGRDAYIDGYEATLLWNSHRYGSRERVRQFAADSYDRSFYPEGFARHLAAIAASGSWAPELGGVGAPTLVIHGEEDPLIPISGGEQVSELIPGARLMRVADMSHDLPEELWPELTQAIAGHVLGDG